MKIKVKDLEGISENVKTLEELVLPIKITYAISHNIKVLDEEMQTFQSERNKLVVECSEKDENGEPIMEPLDDNRVNYRIKDMGRLEYELGALLESEVSIDIRKISLDDIEEAEEKERYSTLSVKDMNNLSFMLEEEE